MYSPRQFEVVYKGRDILAISIVLLAGGRECGTMICICQDHASGCPSPEYSNN